MLPENSNSVWRYSKGGLRALFSTLASQSDFADNDTVQERNKKTADISRHDVGEFRRLVDSGVNKC